RLLDAAGQDGPRDRVIVHDEDAAGAHREAARSSASRVCTHWISACPSSAVAVLSNSPRLQAASSSRQTSENALAPKVAPFDFRVCAARRAPPVAACPR